MISIPSRAASASAASRHAVTFPFRAAYWVMKKSHT